MADLGGTPIDVAAIGPDGHLYLKQPLSSAPNIATENGSHITVGTSHRAGLVEIQDKHLEPGSARAWLGLVNGRPWLVTDLHAANFIGDNQGDARINDPVIGIISRETLENVPGLRAVVQEAARRSQELGDRANRLFMSTQAVADTSKSGDKKNDALSQRPTFDTRANSANSPEFIARIVFGADRSGRQKEPPSKTLQGNRAAIAEEYQRLTRWAREQGLIFEPSQLGGELDSLGEHRVYHIKGAKRLYKATYPGLSGLTRRAMELRDGTLRVMEDDALPSEYFDRWVLHNEMLDDDTRFEGIIENAAGNSIVISQPYIEGSHSDKSPDLTLAGWTQE